MKRMKIIVALACTLCMFALPACGANNGGNDGGDSGINGGDAGGLKNFSADIALNDSSVVYDGQPHSLQVSGELPAGTRVEYDGNGRTEAGEYAVTAELSCAGYADKSLSATLTIERAEFGADIALNGARVRYDGQPHSLQVTGALPAGTRVEYDGNGRTEAGEYTVTATLTNANYKTKTLSATLEIYKFTDAAQEVIGDLLGRPQPWEFLPDAMRPENMAYDGQIDAGCSTQTDVGELPVKFIGRQLNVAHDILGRSDAVLSAADTVFAAGEIIASAYRAFIDENPGDADVFETTLTLGGVQADIAVAVDGESSSLTASVGGVNIALSHNAAAGAEWRNVGRIELTDGITLSYRMSDGALCLALRFTLGGVGYMQYLQFSRSGDAVEGRLAEFVGAESVAIKTSALLYSDGQITAVISDKRESADLPVEAFAEVYSSSDGRYIGGEVHESVAVVDYETLWLPLGYVDGIDSVRVAPKLPDADNAMNPDTVYVNGSSQPFVPEYNTVPIVGTRTSRHYDIELRTVWYYAEVDGEASKVETEMPMLFVQRENIADFTAEVLANNGFAAGLPLLNANLADGVFTDYEQAFEQFKQEITFSWLYDFIG